MAFFKRKRYNFFIKLIAIALFILTLIMILGTILIVAETKTLSSYHSYHEWNIVGHTIKKTDNGNYNLTLEIKNISAYDAHIEDYCIRLEYGNSSYIDYIAANYPDGYFYDTLNSPIIPPGETITHSITFEAPEGLSSIRIRYIGESYMLADVRGNDENYKYYSVDLK
ncbi:MAG: hypothetical protein J6K17_01315 [Oscillospiraceae bacterium]|nr:hypothetical protein [Oscillospiraceae bacterium]